jgi:hypothetical protein
MHFSDWMGRLARHLDWDWLAEGRLNIEDLAEFEPRVNDGLNYLPGSTNMTGSGKSRNEFPPEASIPAGAAPLESILCIEELHRRPPHPPDYETENRAPVALVSAPADSPQTILQILADKALAMLQADSAGLSLFTKRQKAVPPDGDCRRVAAAHRWRYSTRFRPMRRRARSQYSDPIYSLGAALSVLRRPFSHTALLQAIRTALGME